MTQRSKKVVVVGGGHAGVEFCAALRERGFSASVCLVSGDTVYPYERPPRGRMEAVFGVNAAAEVQAGRRLIATGKSLPEDVLANAKWPLRAILKEVA